MNKVLGGLMLVLSGSLSILPGSLLADDEKPFRSFWENEFRLGNSNQQGGQAVQSFGYTGTYEMSEDGDFLSADLSGTRQKVEGVFSKTGSLTLGGGLGLGAFSPSLNVGYESGESALRQFDLSFGLGFQVSEPFSLNLSLGGTAGNHQGDVTGFLLSKYQGNPGVLAIINAKAPLTAQIDTAEIINSLGATYNLLDGWAISLTFGYDYLYTYQIQSIKDPSLKFAVDQADQTVTTTLGLDFTLFKGFVLEVEPQVGREYQPAGGAYSRQTGGLVETAVATTQNFIGGTVSVTYNFQ